MKNLTNNLATNKSFQNKVFIAGMVIAVIAVVIAHYFFGVTFKSN